MRGIQRRSCNSFRFSLPTFSTPTRCRHCTKLLDCGGLVLLVIAIYAGIANAQASRGVMDRNGGAIVLEPYAPNIIRVTLSLDKNAAQSAPGFGFVATPGADGWTHQQGEMGDVYRSSRLVVTVALNHPSKPMATQVDIGKFFNGSAPPANISIRTPEGKTLLQLTGWSMSVPNRKDGNAGVLNFIGEADRWRGEPLYEAIVKRLREFEISGATVYRGILGYGAKGLTHKENFWHLSKDLPIMIAVIDSAEKLSEASVALEEMIADGLIVFSDVVMVRLESPHATGQPS